MTTILTSNGIHRVDNRAFPIQRMSPISLNLQPHDAQHHIQSSCCMNRSHASDETSIQPEPNEQWTSTARMNERDLLLWEHSQQTDKKGSSGPAPDNYWTARCSAWRWTNSLLVKHMEMATLQRGACNYAEGLTVEPIAIVNWYLRAALQECRIIHQLLVFKRAL